MPESIRIQCNVIKRAGQFVMVSVEGGFNTTFLIIHEPSGEVQYTEYCSEYIEEGWANLLDNEERKHAKLGN